MFVVPSSRPLLPFKFIKIILFLSRCKFIHLFLTALLTVAELSRSGRKNWARDDPDERTCKTDLIKVGLWRKNKSIVIVKKKVFFSKYNADNFFLVTSIYKDRKLETSLQGFFFQSVLPI